jgi:phosphatidylglycerophosphate synthase
MANTITLSRLPFLVAIVILLYVGSPMVRVASAGLVFILIAMDSLDGIVARRRGEVGMLGSKLDIAVDRVRSPFPSSSSFAGRWSTPCAALAWYSARLLSG